MADAARQIEETNQDDKADSRVQPRAEVHVDIDIFSEHNFWAGFSMNVSEGGVFVATHANVPVGTMLIVHLNLPGEADPLVTLAEVRWSRAYTGQADVPPGLGLQFVALDAATAQKVRAFVEKVREPLFYDD